MEPILERCPSCHANITIDARDFGTRLRCWSCRRLYDVSPGGLSPAVEEPEPGPETEGFVFAAVGDVHGKMHRMVEQVEQAAAAAGVEVELVLQVGDFEPHRHDDDVASMAAPSRYRVLGDFPDFHARTASFPWPVLFVGGNHEPYGWLEHHPGGAELIPGCRYLGREGLWEHRGLRVAGLSGIMRPDQIDQHRPHVRAFATTSNKRFIGYTREEIGRLMDRCQDAAPHVLLLHEWPRVALGSPERVQLLQFFAHQGHEVGNEDEEEELDFPRLRDQATVGTAEALELVQLIEPGLVLCGHVHAPLRTCIEAPGGRVALRALAKIDAGPDAVALFRFDPVGGLEEIEG